jgi:hypothetical protein
MNNVMSKFEKAIHQTEDEQPHAPKPIRSITPPRRGANKIEIENEPQPRAADVVSAFEKIEDTLPQQGFIRSRKEQFSSPGEATEQHKTHITDDIMFGSAKQTAAIFANSEQQQNERWLNRLKTIEKSGITIEGELAEKGIAKSRLALFNDPNAVVSTQQHPSHILPVNELDSEIFQSASGIAKERVNLFKNLEQQSSNMRTSPSKEFKKLKEFTPPPQLDHVQRQYIIIDKENGNDENNVNQTKHESYNREEFIPESGN